MESYFKSWDLRYTLGISKDYENFSRNSTDELKMKNSLKVEDDKKKVGCGDPDTDILPIHCIIQKFSSLKYLKGLHCQLYENKTFSDENWWEGECKKNEMNIMIPENTAMDDLVRTAIIKLGYPAFVSSFATGSILIRNWNPLPLEVICPDMKKTVTEILGEITGVISLRIQIFQPKLTVSQKIKDDLLSFLIKINQNFLRDSCCPFDVSELSKFCDHSASMKMHLLEEPPEDLQRKFDTWLKQLQETEKAVADRRAQFPTSFFFANNNKNINTTNHQNVGGKKKILEYVEPSTLETNGKLSKIPSEKENLNFVKEPPFIMVDGQKHFPTPKTRVRTSFDPEFELPKLQKWYLKNPHPSRQQIYEYVAELNSLESRKGKKQLDVNNVVYWFKNARAAQKRTECRRFSSGAIPETNRCNILKMPLGRNSEFPSDDQKFISDDEASATSESEDDCRQENGRCLQVVGKWNSNGQGEAVLEMQIPSRKSECVPLELQTKKEKLNEDEENSRNSQEKSNDSVKQDSEKIRISISFQSGASEKILNQKESKVEENKNGTKTDEESGNQQNQNVESKSEISLKELSKSSFLSYEESKNVTENDFLSPYKSGFPVPPNSGFNPSFISLSSHMSSKPTNLPLSTEERRKRNRTFIDPVTEVPRLEQWFRLSTHPSHNLIARYTEELNNMSYRRKFPKLEAKNVQFWFKNRRAKNKRLNYLETNNS